MPFTPTKLYYKIGEACRIIGVEPYVLRYWETEFAALAPPKNKAGQRIYRPKDIELLLEIRKLLYDEGFTIAGARKQIGSGTRRPEKQALAKTGRRRAPQARKVKHREEPTQRLREVRAELENILTLLDSE